MKKIILGTCTLIALVTSANSMAASIECFNKKTNKSVLNLFDDSGSVTTGELKFGKSVYDLGNLESGHGYSYYYGQYLLISETINLNQVEVVAVSTKSNYFEGKISVTSPDNQNVLLQVYCRE